MLFICRSSVSLFFIPLLVLPLTAEGNFFSRIIRTGEDASSNKGQPAGATKAQGSEAQVGSIISFEDSVPLATLANGNRMPLVGFGVDGLASKYIPGFVSSAMAGNKKTRLVDTTRASENERLVSQGIIRGVEKLSGDDKVEVHVVTKVWYTHLGYQRTKLSIEESFQELKSAIAHPKVNLKVHVLLYWPRCFDSIPWMDCKADEEAVPENIKNAGPNPGDDPDNAWKESWKALEDLYLSEKYPIASIGIANFHLKELEIMEGFARIQPHVLQVSLWSLLYDSILVEYCHKHRIHLQVSNAIETTISKIDAAPKASHHLKKVAADLSREVRVDLTTEQVILAWLLQHGVSVVSRTTNVLRQEQHSAVTLSRVPAFSDHQVELIAHAVESFLSGVDMEHDAHVSVTFHAVNKDIMIYWMGNEGEVRIAFVPKGDSFNETTYPGHLFRTYDVSNKDIYIEHEIQEAYGEDKHIHVEL